MIPLSQWVTSAGYFRGHGTTGFGVAPHGDAPTPLRTGVRYFRPLIIMNYNGGNGTQECDWIRVERLVTPDDADNTDKKRLVPDLEFERSTGGDYWYQITSGSRTRALPWWFPNRATSAVISRISPSSPESFRI